MAYFLLAVSLGLSVLKNLLSKGGRDVFRGGRNLMLSNVMTGAVAMIVFAIAGVDFSAFRDPLFVTLAFLYGLATVGSQSLYIMAVRNGSLSICSLIYSASFLIPTVFSAVVYREPMTWNKVVGMLCMLLAILLVSGKGKGPEKMGRLSWILVFLSMLCSGSVGVLQRVVGHRWNGENQTGYLCGAFVCLFILSGIGPVLFRKRGERIEYSKRRFLLFGGAMAVCVTFANRLNTYLGGGALPGMVFFPVLNGGCILLSALASRVLFRERLSLRQLIGIGIGLCAMICLAI